MMSLKEQFMLDPDVVFLNHGSFGATPRPVFEAYQAWQSRLERQPVRFLAEELIDHLRAARQALGAYLRADPDHLVYVPNATFAVNVVARSLNLRPGDEVLTTDHEYGACDNAWEFNCGKGGASCVRQCIPLPLASPDQIVERLWERATHRTRAIFLSHITSPTAQCLPVEPVCQRAREAGILTVVDGAHAPGQIPLDLPAIGADFYVGDCHKWMLGPKGSAFLYTRREAQHLVEPLVVSWGWGENLSISAGSSYLDHLEWWGTKDPAAYLAVPAAIQFQDQNDWPAARRSCHELARQALQRVCDLTALPSPYTDDEGFYNQMMIAALPPIDDPRDLKARLYDDFRVEVPCITWNGRQFVRVSVQGYNTQADIDALLTALEAVLPR
jgi:isopenicillin-N epimerase